MEIKTLEYTSIETIVSCLSQAFANYFVAMPSDVDFWDNRFKNARFNKALSWGVFDHDHLVGFIINGIDTIGGIKTAFNTGTGVLPAYRGKHLVDKMYEFGIPLLKEQGVQICTLEVIDKNERAIRVYKRIGFALQQKLFCFKGNLKQKNNTQIVASHLLEIQEYRANAHYSWDNKLPSIKPAGDAYEVYKVQEKQKEIGYFIINPQKGYIAQLEAEPQKWQCLFDGISQVSTSIRINNIHEDRKDLLSFLEQSNIENTINQYQMKMKI